MTLSPDHIEQHLIDGHAPAGGRGSYAAPRHHLRRGKSRDRPTPVGAAQVAAWVIVDGTD